MYNHLSNAFFVLCWKLRCHGLFDVPDTEMNFALGNWEKWKTFKNWHDDWKWIWITRRNSMTMINSVLKGEFYCISNWLESLKYKRTWRKKTVCQHFQTVICFLYTLKSQSVGDLVTDDGSSKYPKPIEKKMKRKNSTEKEKPSMYV